MGGATRVLWKSWTPASETERQWIPVSRKRPQNPARKEQERGDILDKVALPSSHGGRARNSVTRASGNNDSSAVVDIRS